MVDVIDKNTKFKQQNLNRDPLSGEIEAHPVGTGLGAAFGGSAATLAGAVVGGPVGAAAGAIIGAVVGGLTGKDIAEDANPTIVDAYWNTNYANRPYTKADTDYEYYRPAYNFGYEQRNANPKKKFSEVEDTLRTNWSKSESSKKLNWDEAKEPVRDSYELEDGFYNVKANSEIAPRKTNRN